MKQTNLFYVFHELFFTVPKFNAVVCFLFSLFVGLIKQCWPTVYTLRGGSSETKPGILLCCTGVYGPLGHLPLQGHYQVLVHMHTPHLQNIH